MKLNVLLFAALLTHGVAAFAEGDHSAMTHHDHSMGASATVLTEAGNDAFGTIQEVIARLNSDPDTDWSKVNIEALRQHLVDMNEMTLNVEVISQTPIAQGMEAIVKPLTARSAAALERVLKVHPAQLQRESGWVMQVVKNADAYRLIITTKNSYEISKIRGLGYIGVMAYGTHHQLHHWAMASGENPHAQHHLQ
ncbi:hypothetical protein [uncultured Amphritea sp.]|uniref:hypothetical protein n=1 Tax=uncultured Amphritea sp. TaxID=981605 RepID=UPI00262FAF1A|nr:hypothetical protein [uncultured Amphritea sp.]